MNRKIIQLVESLTGLGFEEKCKKLEAYINGERQQAYFQAQAKIMEGFRTKKKQ